MPKNPFEAAKEYDRPRHPRTLSKKWEKRRRKDLAKEGMTGLQDQDRVISSQRRAAHGASPPFLPGDMGKGPRKKK